MQQMRVIYSGSNIINIYIDIEVPTFTKYGLYNVQVIWKVFDIMEDKYTYYIWTLAC